MLHKGPYIHSRTTPSNSQVVLQSSSVLPWEITMYLLLLLLTFIQGEPPTLADSSPMILSKLELDSNPLLGQVFATPCSCCRGDAVLFFMTTRPAAAAAAAASPFDEEGK